MTHKGCSHSKRKEKFQRPTGLRPKPEVSGVNLKGATAKRSETAPFPEAEGKARGNKKAKANRSDSPGSSP